MTIEGKDREIIEKVKSEIKKNLLNCVDVVAPTALTTLKGYSGSFNRMFQFVITIEKNKRLVRLYIMSDYFGGRTIKDIIEKVNNNCIPLIKEENGLQFNPGDKIESMPYVLLKSDGKIETRLI